MAKILSLALRPRSLSALCGQESTVAAIRKQMVFRQPASWMFTGPSGCGKTTIANILAITFQCTHMTVWGDPCDECWKRKLEFAIHETNASDQTGVEDVRKIVEISRYKPIGEGKRVIILNECQRLSGNAQDLLLDPTEKPPAHLIWIFCTTAPQKILPTLRKRCVTYQMKLLGFDASETFLTRQAARAKITLSLAPLFEQCHLMQIAAPRDLLMALEKYASGLSAVEAVAGTDESGIDSLRVCKAMTSGQWKTVAAALKNASSDQARWIRASCSGWLRGVLEREGTGSGGDRAATSLLELCAPPLEDSTMMVWLWAVLWKVTKRYQGVGR